ncbi:hypothetical protein K457DRAFT_152173 [Linnemannia elongata AG-77]|uniref:Mediator of RNA polymerase II transcription subunit 8 n=1 Tax=Linnemannia elongata AG-77 TaxID=1314771 RepID=A0A197KBF1_9FUNG|nr:hypothetical protein K457DRAFT_152173 [Linnemannia elongata AG-77]
MNTTHLSVEERRTMEYLESVKTRLVQLHESIHFFLRSINPETTPGTVSWTELHSKFNVLIAKYLHLTNILNNPQITLQPRDYTVFPFEPPANDQQVQNLSVLLRTKLFPELEQADEERIREGTIPGLPVLPPSPAPNKAVNPNALNVPYGTPEEKKQWNVYKLKVAMHDELCRKADGIFEQQRDTVHTKVRYESDDDDEDGNEEDVAVGAENGGGGTKRERDTSGPSGAGISNKKSKVEANPLPTDEFLGGSSASVRYVDDWAGNLNDMDGYSSGADDQAGEGAGIEGDDVFDDSYFEARRREGALSSDGDDEEEEEESSEEELESLQGDESAEQSLDQGHGEEEDEEEDAFMEVVSPTAPISSQISSAGSNVSMVPAVETFEEEDDDDEEEMEEVGNV